MASKFLPPLASREGLLYPAEGQWVRNVNLDRLATLAKNLDTTESRQALDKLRSVPTPWARLLLFESALYDTDHPAHPEVQAQWRGLLGLLGLADLLGLSGQIKVEAFSLSEQQNGDLKKAFQALRPRDVSGEEDPEGKWNYFNLITLDGVVLGATSPRTIVFTGMSHSCPPSVPFRSPHGGIGDPTEYFKNDPAMLSVLKQWLAALRGEIRADANLQAWLGSRPADPDADPVSRHSQLLKALERWDDSIGRVAQSVTISLADSLLPGKFAVVRRATADIPKESDLFLQGHRDVIVAFRPARNSFLHDATGRKVVDKPVRVFGGYRVAAGKDLPEDFNFLPPDIKVISDPAELLEDSLIEVQIATDAVHYLPFESKYYLLPFRKKITEYLNDADLVGLSNQTQVTRLQGGTTLRLEVRIPLFGGGAVHVHKDYPQGNVLTIDDYPTQQLAMWPDFVCTGPAGGGPSPFGHYFYYVSDVKPTGQVEFNPLRDGLLSRDVPGKGRRVWYTGGEPVQGFVGSVGGRQGLLLIRQTPLDLPAKLWRVGVDFGSTHTSVFYREVSRTSDGRLVPVPGADIQPLPIRPRVRILTQGDQFQLQQNFFFWSAGAAATTSGDGSFPTQLIIPANKYEDHGNSWLPREGQVFLSSLLDINPSNKLETDLKWNADQADYATRAFLRSLLVMVEAEAVAGGALIARVEHSYPTAFPPDLVNKHSNEWAGAERCVGVGVSASPLSEAVAVCRHLWAEQAALPAVNTIAFDIGGSTTDIAIWTQNTMVIQESVKMGAGSVGTYIEKENPPQFSTWFEGLLRGQPFNSNFLLPQRGLTKGIFHAALNRLAENNLLDQFIDSVRASSGKKEVRQFLSHIIFLIAAVSYYAGLLTRKAGANTLTQYYLYFCGRGGQLFRWVPKADELVKEMYLAGLLGPGHAAGAGPGVAAHVSKFPKQEVGRGLLIEHQQLQVQDGQGGGILTETKETVTAAEDGYPGLQWDDNLTYEKLRVAAANVPQLDRLREVNHFVRTFGGSALTKGVADVLRLSAHFPSEHYRNTLMGRLNDNLQAGAGGALIEPLFITEAKSLLEVLTERTGLFD